MLHCWICNQNGLSRGGDPPIGQEGGAKLVTGRSFKQQQQEEGKQVDAKFVSGFTLRNAKDMYYLQLTKAQTNVDLLSKLWLVILDGEGCCK